MTLQISIASRMKCLEIPKFLAVISVSLLLDLEVRSRILKVLIPQFPSKRYIKKKNFYINSLSIKLNLSGSDNDNILTSWENKILIHFYETNKQISHF